VKTVLIIQSEMKHYRVPFFTSLSAALQRDGIKLTVAYSNSNSLHALRNDSADLPPPVGRRVAGRWFFGRFVYQSLWRDILTSDLVITGSEVKYLINPILLVMSRVGLKTVAFWGLGPNRHPDRSVFAEWAKQHFFTCVDWWFAYTSSVAEYLKEKGMPADKITNVQNATDSTELTKLINGISDADVLEAKVSLTGTPNARIGFYCGLIGEIKALPMLLETARLVKLRCPDFHLVLIGNGPQRLWLEAEIANEPWIHYLGSKYGRESALYYKMADVFVMAGAAGLAVVDSFAAGLPLMVTDLPTHPPEISYVTDGENGRMAPHEANAFAHAIVEVLTSPTLMEKLRNGARIAGGRYTIEAMVENYRLGITRCLRYYGASSGADVTDLALPRT
jgi:glycosyltransferase involved in cell wall biosynthesis